MSLSDSLTSNVDTYTYRLLHRVLSRDIEPASRTSRHYFYRSDMSPLLTEVDDEARGWFWDVGAAPRASGWIMIQPLAHARGTVTTTLYLNPLDASCALSASATTESKLFRPPDLARSFLMNSWRSFDNCMISARICRRWAWRFSISCFRSAGARRRSSSGNSSGFTSSSFTVPFSILCKKSPA